MQYSIEDTIRKELSPIKITSYAYEKANYIARRVCELAGTPLEVAFYLLDDSLVNRQPDITIRDVIIGHEQVVRPLHCEITPMGKLKSFKEVKSQGKRIVGFGHSHANISNFYSSEDVDTILSHVNDWGIKKELEEIIDLTQEENELTYYFDGENRGLKLTLNGQTYTIQSTMFDDHSEEYNQNQKFVLLQKQQLTIPFFYGMTFNAANERPYCVIAYIHNGRAEQFSEGITYKIVPPRKHRELDKEKIDAELILRVRKLNNIFNNYKSVLENTRQLIKESALNGLRSLSSLKYNNGLTPRQEYEYLSQLYHSMTSIGHAFSKFQPRKSKNKMLNEISNLEKMYDDMIKYSTRLASRTTSCQQRFDKRITELQKQSSNIKKPLQKRSLDKRILLYTNIMKIGNLLYEVEHVYPH